MSFSEGWLDRRGGRAYRPAYDRWPYARQINYERGRKLAAVAQCSGTINKIRVFAADACARLIGKGRIGWARHELRNQLTRRGSRATK